MVSDSVVQLTRQSYLQNRNRDTEVKNKPMDTKGGKEGVMPMLQRRKQRPRNEPVTCARLPQ